MRLFYIYFINIMQRCLILKERSCNDAVWAHSEQVGNREDVLLRYSRVNGAWEEMVCAEQRVFY